MYITYFKGDQRNTKNGTEHWFEFEELSKELSKCVKGGKHSAYFVRGLLEPMERKDINLEASELLIMDIDEGVRGRNAPKPKDFHEAMVELGLNHFIYTSHSHNLEQNKFRCVVPTSTSMCKDDLIINMQEVMAELATKAIRFKDVREQTVWSQPWFVPTRDDPDDGLFEFYEYHEGEEWKTIAGTEVVADKVVKKDVESVGLQGDSLESMYENIRTGKEYHESMLNISFQLVKDGMSAAHTKAVLETLMNSSQDAGSDRWRQRMNEIDRIVDGAIGREQSEFELIEIEDSANDEYHLPKPPGLLGELYDNCYDRLLYQYPEVAMVSSLGLVAGIAGRRFNVMEPARAGLNLYLTIIAGTGFGKEGINKLISSYLRGEDRGFQNYDSFIGPSSFTGTKAIYNAFKDARSRVCVMSEAGLMMKVKSGDVEGKTAALLDAFSTSDSESYSKFHTYSNEEDSVQSLRAMAVTIVSESTPDQLMDAYRQSGALNSGYLPRQMLFKIDKRQTKVNRNVKDSIIPAKISERVDQLLQTCAMVQAEDDPKSYDMYFHADIAESVYDYVDEWNVISRDAEENHDEVRAKMATRVAQKTVRVAALATVFNKPRGSSDCLIIDKCEWEWAKALLECEFHRVTKALDGLSGNGAFDGAAYEVCKKLIGILDGSVKDKKAMPDVRYRKRKIVPYSMIKKACLSNPHLRALEGDPKFSARHTSGLDKVLNHLKDYGAIEIKADPIGKYAKCIFVKEGVNEVMESLM